MQEMLNAVYSILFLAINFLIYSRLSKNQELPKHAYSLVIGALILISLLHTGGLKIEGLMSLQEFMDIFMFSLALLILHFGTTFQERFINRFNVKSNAQNRIITKKTLQVFDVLRSKVIYIMISAYQILAVWIPEVR